MSVSEAVKDRIYGIDLGTTYSCIAYFDEDTGQVAPISNVDEQLTTPSVVWTSPKGEYEVGQTAKNRGDADTVAFVKRYMGRDTVIRSGGKAFRPEEISALVLKKLITDASQVLEQRGKLDHPIKRVVITVPAYFGSAERKATRDAGEIAGLEVVELLNEPTAAALSYRVGQPPTNDVFLVYDLGGGTFDITLVQVTGNTVTEIAIKGDHQRGGYDWDRQLLNLAIEKMIEKNPDASEARSDEQWRREMLIDIEEHKKQLSKNEAVSIPLLYRDKIYYASVTREEFEAATAGLLAGTVDMVEGVLDEVKDDNLKPRRIYMVGGSSKMPAVRKALDDLIERKLGHKIEVIFGNPDLAVAKGAAFHAGILRIREIMAESGGDTSVIRQLYPNLVPYLTVNAVYRVLSRALGFKVQRADDPADCYVDHLANTNDSLPLSREKTYGTSDPNQDIVGFKIFEQASAEPSADLNSNRMLKEMVMEGLGPFSLPKGSDLFVTLQVQPDGTVTARAVEPKSKKEVSMTLSIEGGMDKQAVDVSRKAIDQMKEKV